MKRFLFFFLFVFQCAAAEVLIPQSSLRLEANDNTTDFSQFSVYFSVDCRYTTLGEEMPISCGDRSVEIKVTSDGVIAIPEVKKFRDVFIPFSTPHYEADLTIYANNINIGSIHPTKGLKKFTFDNHTLYIQKINPAVMNLTIDGKDILGTDLVKLPRSSLALVFKRDLSDNFENFTFNRNPYLWLRDNYAREPLSKVQEIKVLTHYYASFTPPAKDKVNLLVVAYSGEGSTSFKAEVPLDLESDVLVKLGPIELK